MKMDRTTGILKHVAAVALIVLLALILYWPALQGFFLFDDFSNLKTLANVAGSGIFDRAMWDFIFSGEAGPLGSPLSLLTFALQADAWPVDTFPFKLFNLLLHVINTALVYGLCVQLGRIVKLNDAAVFFTAALTTALWALHPLHITAVLYSAHRTILLSSFFMLCGMLCYLHYRPQFDGGSRLKHLLPITLGLGTAGVLGLLSEENAVALLLYVIALEYTVFAAAVVNPRLRVWRLGALWLPFILLLALVLSYVLATMGRYTNMVEFTMLERLLTESRVLWLYLAQLFNPGVDSARLFYTPSLSTSLLSPLTTLLACAAWLLVVVVAFNYRRRYPIFALAVFWYLAGHSIESTVLPLELYFNHRNYLAILGPLLASTHLLVLLRERTSESLHMFYWAVPVLVIFVAGFQTSYNARLWQQPLNLAADWYANDPAELRNAEFYAIEISRTGREGVQKASVVYDDILLRNPEDLRPLFNRMLMICISDSIPLPASEVVNSHISQSRATERDMETAINELINQTLAGNCPGVPVAYLEAVLQQALPHLNGQVKSPTLFGLAKIRQQAGDNEVALNLYDQAFAVIEDPGVLFAKAILQLQMQDADGALVTINAANNLVLAKNDILTGTVESKLAMLNELRISAENMLSNTENPSDI